MKEDELRMSRQNKEGGTGSKADMVKRPNPRKSLISMLIKDNSALFLRRFGRPGQTQSSSVKPQTTKKILSRPPT
jgi:hypothetical protein